MELQKITTMLPHGAVREIAKRIKLSESTISNVLSGKKQSPRAAEIMQAAADYVTEYKAREREAKERLAAALNN